MVGYKVKWNDVAINDFDSNDKVLQESRIYTIIKEINDSCCLIADEFGEAEVFYSELEIIIEDRIPIDLQSWEDAPCPINTKNVNIDKAEKVLYLSMCSNHGYDKNDIQTFFNGNGNWRERDKFFEILCMEEEYAVIDNGGIYYEDIEEEENP